MNSLRGCIISFFSFLTESGDTPAPEPAKSYVPQGWQVRRKGKDYWENDQSEADPEDELRPIDQTPKAEEGRDFTVEAGDHVDAQHSFQKKRAKLGDFARDQALAAVNKVADILGEGGANSAPNYEEVARQLRASTPDKYADIVLKAIEPHLAGKGLDDVLRPVEDAVTNYKRLTVQSQPQMGQQIQSQLAEQDLPSKQSRAAIIDRQMEKANKDLEIAATQRQAQRIKETMAFLGQQKAALGDLGQPKEEEQQAPVGSAPVTNFMKGLGVTREQLVPRLHTALDKVGIPKEQWEDQNVDPSAGMMRVLSELDPKGQFANLMVQQLATARQEDMAAKQNVSARGGALAGGKADQGQGTDDTERAIEGKEARMRQLYAELRQAPFMQTWPGMILYVLVGIVTQNPAFAARLIGGVGNRAAVDAEMKGLHYDLKRLDDKLHYERQNEIYTKREAARRMNKKEDETDQRKWELSKLMLNHQLIIKRNAARGNPETFLLKKLSSDFQRNLGMASKFQGTMQNEFADPKDRAVAKQNFDVYMRRAAELDSQIRQMGVTSAGEDQVGADGE